MSRTRHPLLLLTALALGLTACAPAEAPADTAAPESAPASQASESEAPDAEYPLTLDSEALTHEVVIDKQPERIAVLSFDAAIALHELGLTDSIVAIPETAANASINPYAEEMAEVENTIAGGNDPEPEQVLAWSPDLIVVTARHTGEQDASDVLSSTGVPVISFSNGWATADAVIENLTILGEATGHADAAAELADEIHDGVAAVREQSATAEETPSVAIISNQAGPAFINASTSLVSELVTNAGGTNIADAAGITKTMPIQPEQLVAANPDYIMLVDVSGRGESSFSDLLGNPAVAALSAVTENRVHLFAGHEVYGLAGREIVSGSEAILEWLHPELAD